MQIIFRDFPAYQGKFLEKLFIEKLKLKKQYTKIGRYWERGNKNEIDIVAINELEKIALIAEVKINKDKINLSVLKHKAQKLEQKLKGYKIKYIGYSIEDM